uniref:Uncharacterized protein n=1 Tax=Opuntia streptacantha TaxID=393608 RepID=A0A7C9AV29_OPUST
MKGIKKRTRKRIINPQKRGRKNIVAEIGIKQGTLIQGRGPLTVTVKIAKTKERQIGRQVAKTMLTEKEKEQRMRKMMDRDINPQEDTKEGVHRRLVTGVNRVREARWLMMIQVVKHQMIQGGRLTQKDVTCHRHLSGLGKDKFRGLLIASILSAGILLTLLLTVAGKGDQGPGHLLVGIDDYIRSLLVVDDDDSDYIAETIALCPGMFSAVGGSKCEN